MPATHSTTTNPKKIISLCFSLGIQIYTRVPQKQYRLIGIQLLQVTDRPLALPPGDWKCTFFSALVFFLFNAVPRPPSPNDNTLSENTQMRLDFKKIKQQRTSTPLYVIYL
ncbi:hypothetical protein ACI65C_005508 [Semiaphis heraclei]